MFHGASPNCHAIPQIFFVYQYISVKRTWRFHLGISRGTSAAELPFCSWKSWFRLPRRTTDTTQRRRSVPPWGTHGGVGFDSRIFFPGWQVTRVSPYVRGPFPSNQIRPARCTRGVVDPEPASGSVIGADRQRFDPSCVLLKRVPQGRTESGGIVLAANAGPRVPSGGVTLKKRCTYRPSVIYLIVNKLLSLSLSHVLTKATLVQFVFKKKSRMHCILLWKKEKVKLDRGHRRASAHCRGRASESAAGCSRA